MFCNSPDQFDHLSQPLGAPQNMSPAETGNPIHDPHRIFNFSNRAIQVLKNSNKLE